MSMISKIAAFVREEEGLTTVEYAVAGSLVAAAVVTAFTDLGQEVELVISGLCEAVGGTDHTCA